MTDITRRDCYRRLREEGWGRLKSIRWALFLYEFVHQPDVVDLNDPDKWRVADGEEAVEEFFEG